jgi:hypothetical protein
MRTLTILALFSLSLLYAGSTRAEAGAWCARYEDGEGTNCGFASFEQCEADIFGMNGSYCIEPPAAPQVSHGKREHLSD